MKVVPIINRSMHPAEATQYLLRTEQRVAQPRDLILIRPTRWRQDMAITIKDLHTQRELDCGEMASVTGGGAGWVFGWIQPYAERSSNLGASVNFYQTNNYFKADQMNNQVEVIDINNLAANASINVNAKQQALNFKLA
jgi:hypothetical protein